MRRALVVLCCFALLVGSLPARAAGPAPVRLAPEARERFAVAMTFYRAGDWAQAAHEFGEVSAIAAPIAEYALLQQADSLARLGPRGPPARRRRPPRQRAPPPRPLSSGPPTGPPARAPTRGPPRSGAAPPTPPRTPPRRRAPACAWASHWPPRGVRPRPPRPFV